MDSRGGGEHLQVRGDLARRRGKARCACGSAEACAHPSEQVRSPGTPIRQQGARFQRGLFSAGLKPCFPRLKPGA
jgi:hypothetical protein